jgi:hypothetical protein
LIVQAATAEREQNGLGTERKRVRVAFDKSTTFRLAQEGNFSEKRPDTGSRLPGAPPSSAHQAASSRSLSHI